MRRLTVEQCEVISASDPTPQGAARFVTTPMPRGGKRQWLSCLNCGRRVFKLYRPSWESEGAFACRHCYRLTYQSARQHDARLYSLLKASDAVVARQVLHGTPAWKFLAMKAAYIRSGKIRTKWPLQCEEGT